MARSARISCGPRSPYARRGTRAEDTDWPQILGLYDLLASLTPGPMINLNRIVAAAMVHGTEAGPRQLAAAKTEDALAEHHGMVVVRAYLLELKGDRDAASDAYLAAAGRTMRVPEQRYLRSRAAALGSGPAHG